ncbi:MAG: hypothetical protein G01um101413_713 [Parcubacteria group bacterium Gr01-1014_13]|nr:MAG: hypothetical protein G01um101413_713 [Parcubacteria group bacterium Gr01-1014_13]
MKRRPVESSAPPPDTGPFRKMEGIVDTSEDAILQRMEKEIAAEGKFSIRLTEGIKYKDAFPLFADAIKNNIDPKDIIFYSLATGIMKYDNVIEYTPNGILGRVQGKKYIYKSKDDSYIELRIWVEKNKATFDSLTTKEDVEKIKRKQEKEDWYTANYELKDNIGKIKKMIKAGINMELDDLKNNTESLLQTINEKLKEKK